VTSLVCEEDPGPLEGLIECIGKFGACSGVVHCGVRPESQITRGEVPARHEKLTISVSP
jgi:hypothetical protein